MTSFLKKHRSLFLAASLFISMGLGGWYGILPMYERIQGLRDDIQKQYATRENRNRQIAQLPELRVRYDRIVADEGRLDILLTEPRVVDFVRTIEELARATGVEIKIEANDAPLSASKKKAAVKKEGPAEEAAAEKQESQEAKALTDALPYKDYLRLRIILIGEYPAIAAFLGKLETLPIALDVISLDISEQEEELGSAKAAPARPSPFVLVEGSEPAAPAEGEALPSEQPKLPGNLEAVLDTLVYVDK